MVSVSQCDSNKGRLAENDVCDLVPKVVTPHFLSVQEQTRGQASNCKLVRDTYMSQAIGVCKQSWGFYVVPAVTVDLSETQCVMLYPHVELGAIMEICQPTILVDRHGYSVRLAANPSFHRVIDPKRNEDWSPTQAEKSWKPI